MCVQTPHPPAGRGLIPRIKMLAEKFVSFHPSDTPVDTHAMNSLSFYWVNSPIKLKGKYPGGEISPLSPVVKFRTLIGKRSTYVYWSLRVFHKTSLDQELVLRLDSV